MPIFSVNDITAKTLSKYEYTDIINNLEELKQNGGITKQQDFNKLMKYFMKKKFKNIFHYNNLDNYRNIYEKIYEMYSDFSDSQLYYLFEHLLVNKELLIKLLVNNFQFNFRYIYIFLEKLLESNPSIDIKAREEINYIIDKFLERKLIEPEEYNFDYNKKHSYQVFFNYCKELNKINFNKEYVKNFIIKLNFLDDFINHITTNLIHVVSNNFDDLLDFTKSNNISDVIIQKYSIHSKYFWFNIFDLIFTDFYENFKIKLNSLSIDEFTTFIIVIHNIFCIGIDTINFNLYNHFFENYNKKFDELIEKIKNIRSEINIKSMQNYNNIVEILKNFKLIDLYLDDICSKYYFNKFIFQNCYKGEYNAELLNRCIKYKFNQEIIDYLLKEKNIDFNNETFRYSIFAENIVMIKYLLNNKYLASDKDLLYCVNGGNFFKEMYMEYKKYNILINDDTARELYFKFYKVTIPKEYYVNGDNDEHMNKLFEDCDKEFKKIFPYETYYNKTDYAYYYDIAKKGELTLDMILKIHHVVGTDGMKNLIRLYMEFNNINQQKKIVKRVIKKVIKKVVKKI